MFLKCSYIRSIATITRTTSKISSACCHTNKDTSSKSKRVNGKNEFIDMIRQTKRMQIIEKLPQKESLSTLLKVQKVSELPEGFQTVYQFPQIKYFGLINRLKAYYTVFAVLVPAASGLLCCFVHLPWEYLYASTLLGIAGCFMFYSLGFPATRFVGFIYYNQKTDIVRIAYVDFWGRRRDIHVPLSDIMPKDECPTSFTDKLWHSLRRFSTDEIFKLQLQQGVIVDEAAMKKILL